MNAGGGGTTQRSTAVVIVLAVCAVALFLGFSIKNLCTTHQWDGYQYRTTCYNDIYALYSFRGISMHDETHAAVVDGKLTSVTVRVMHFPYVDGNGKLDDTPDGDLEYPVGTGYFIGAIARAAPDNDPRFFRLTSLGLALCALITALLLALMTKEPMRALYFAAAPSLVLYAMHNWDLLAVVMMVAGLFEFRRGADGWAGGWLGAGASTKLFPGFLLLPLIIVRWREQRRFPLRMVVSALLTAAAFNLPVMLINWRGWMTPWTFQTQRFPNFETSWYMIYRHLSTVLHTNFWANSYGPFTSYAGTLLFLAGLAAVLMLELRRPVFRVYTFSFAILVLFLLTNKVFSPQYVLWVLPFFALLEIPWYGFAVFAISEAMVWFMISNYFIADLMHQHALEAGAPAVIARTAGHENMVLTIVEVFVWVRYAMLLWLLWLSRRVPENVADPAENVEALAVAA